MRDDAGITDEAEFRTALVQSLTVQATFNVQVLAILTSLFPEDEAREKLRPVANQAADLIQIQASLFKFLIEEKDK